MHPKFTRRVATTIVSSSALLAAALCLVPVHGASAQGGGHAGHHADDAATAPARPAPATARRPPPAVTKAGHAHRGEFTQGGAQSGQRRTSTPATAEFQAAHERMMRNMDLPYTGDPDVDFRIQMIPHHQGAIDMARVAMSHAKDPWTRQLAESVIVEQQREIAEMQAWLARRGATVPPGGQPRHVMGANSYRSVGEEAGTSAELVGRSWAPGSGVPAARR